MVVWTQSAQQAGEPSHHFSDRKCDVTVNKEKGNSMGWRGKSEADPLGNLRSHSNQLSSPISGRRKQHRNKGNLDL